MNAITPNVAPDPILTNAGIALEKVEDFKCWPSFPLIHHFFLFF